MSYKHGFNLNLNKVKPSVAHGCLYIGLNGTSEELDLPKNNLWIYPDNIDHDSAVENYLNDNDSDFPLVYISFASSKDPILYLSNAYKWNIKTLFHWIKLNKKNEIYFS